jgi:fatty acid desaturase
MEPVAPESDPFFDAGWAEREGAWRRRLGRIRLGAEPLDQQLARSRRVTWALTVIAAIIAAQFIALFAAFHAPATGAVVAGVLFLPVVVFAWLEDWSRHRRVAAYLRERRQYAAKAGQPITGAAPEV